MDRIFVDFGIELCDYFKVFTDAQEKQQLANHYKGIQ